MSMMSQQEFFELADRYIRKEMTKEEISSFESFCAENPSFSAQLQQHREFLDHFNTTQLRVDFKQQLASSAKNYHRSHQSAKIIPMKQTKIVSLWERLKASSLVAAVVAVLAVFSTLWGSGYYKNIDKAKTDYSALKRDMNTVKKNVNEHNAAIRNINTASKTNESADSQFGATGFMVSNNGYVVTNYHVVSGADSVYLQNNKGESYKAQVIHADAKNDLAILLIEDSSFKKSKTLPYTFKTNATDLGEDIYTIGFPRDEAVYGQGYLSSATGYAGDTIAYQISIPVNPGNSGGPVLDSKGNIIGIISGKQRGIDGAAFAIKTKSILRALDAIPTDSLKGQVKLNKKNTLSALSRTEQIKKLQDYIYMVKVY